MKKLITLLALFTFTILQTPIANAANVEITITEPTHRQIDGAFIDDELIGLLAYEGRLGQLVFNPARGNRSWFIDPQLIEEVTAMTSDYVLTNGDAGTGGDVAKAWLNQFSAITRGERITALPYGNPSGYWISKLAPTQKDFYLQFGAKRLTAIIGREVSQMRSYPSGDSYKVDFLTTQAFRESQSVLKINSAYMSIEEVEKFQAQSAAVFHPALMNGNRTLLGLDLITSTQLLSNKIRLAPGRFTVTSTKQNLPITLINDFPNPATIAVKVSASNGKVLVGLVENQVVNGKSKVQVMIPVEVVTSGNSDLTVSLSTDKGRALSSEVIYPVTLKVISPIATWITSGGAIILFISALVQSFRRIRKKRI
ncbi:unannotated protein [freshwater metagenome]|uniref:Unannotated protein n=1 Tax=freshwater metagenome TaxID=449393 RepID=A0A6J6U9Y9_9ZZZZ|nr:hypothetical protein [Actinomycetota bacterium]